MEVMKPWNGTCPSCGDTRAYQSFLSWECPNPDCKYHTKTQEDLVEAAKKEPATHSPIAPPFLPDEEEEKPTMGKTTIPFYPYGGAPDPDSKDCDAADNTTTTTPIMTQAGDPDDAAQYGFTSDFSDEPDGIALDWDGFDQGFYTND